MTDFLIIEENLRAAMRFFGDATGGGENASLPGSLAIYSGLDYGVFNIALLEGQVEQGSGINDSENLNFEARLAAVAHYFKARSRNWSFWICDDLLDLSERRKAHPALSRMGLRVISAPPGMITEALSPPVTALPGIELRPVIDDASRQAFGEITSISFEIPIAITQKIYFPARAWNGAYQGFVAYVNGRPVSIVAIVVAAESLGVYSLATHPDHRRRGYGEATMRAAVEEARRRTGFSRVVLQSTEAGYPLYRRMGFRGATRFTVYLTR